MKPKLINYIPFYGLFTYIQPHFTELVNLEINGVDNNDILEHHKTLRLLEYYHLVWLTLVMTICVLLVLYILLP